MLGAEAGETAGDSNSSSRINKSETGTIGETTSNKHNRNRNNNKINSNNDSKATANARGVVAIIISLHANVW